MKRRTWIVIGVIAAQVLVLVHMAAQREWVLLTGETVLLRTAPVDPRDYMRGDYVRLSYDISSVPRAKCRDGVLPLFDEKRSATSAKDMRVYALLERNSSGVAELVALTDVQPTDGLFIRGRVDYVWPKFVRVRYGIEAMFMQQGTARELEVSRSGDRDGLPLDGEVALAPDGLAVLKGHVWEPLGLRLTLERRTPPSDETPVATDERPPDVSRLRGLIAVSLELKNHSDHPVAIVDRANGRSFRLVGANDAWNEASHRWVGENTPLPSPTPGEVVVLPPGGTHSVLIDLTDPSWFVTRIPSPSDGPTVDNGPMSLESLQNAWSTRFRFEYVPPTDAECADLPHAEQIRRMGVRSRAFSPTGTID